MLNLFPGTVTDKWSSLNHYIYRVPKKQIQVFVHTPLSTTLNLTLDRLAQVSEVKALIDDRLGITVEKQELFVGSLKVSVIWTRNLLDWLWL